ncbi:MAG: hypothetical protein JKY60_15260, partial [Kordiimonadaceae bacterium]|nr:hypothetical protein [Kordiimonadaceae bacterium]
YDTYPDIITGFHDFGFNIDRDFFAFRSDDQVVCWNLVLAGLGLGFTQIDIGEDAEGIERVLPHLDLPTLPIWLTAHAELKTSRRVRRVYDFLAEHLQRYNAGG